MRELLNKVIISFCASIFVFTLVLTPHTAQAQGADVGLVYSNFRFSKTPFVVGESLRFYASIRNLGDADVAGTISFYLSGDIIGRPVPFSSVTSGTYEEVWVDFVVPEEEFNIDVQLRADVDTNETNNGYLSPRYTPVRDTDGDGITDDTDNCVTTQNQNQADANRNGVGDACDEEEEEEEVIVVPVQPDPIVVPTPEPTPDPVVTESPLVGVVARVEQEVSAIIAPDGAVSVESALEAQEEVAPSPEGNVILSPNARFSYERVGWNVYVFKGYSATKGAVYTWEVSDGRTQVGSEATFHFPQPGLYTVKLVTSVNDGTFVSEDVVIRVSFFHLQNPWLASLIAGLLVLCGVILWQSVRARKQPIE